MARFSPVRSSPQFDRSIWRRLLARPFQPFPLPLPVTFRIKFETSDGRTRSLDITAPSRDAAIAQWDRLRQPGDFIESIGRPCRIEWPQD